MLTEQRRRNKVEVERWSMLFPQVRLSQVVSPVEDATVEWNALTSSDDRLLNYKCVLGL